MTIIPFSQTFRIVETEGKFYPQYKTGDFWYHWRGLKNFGTEDEAREFLRIAAEKRIVKRDTYHERNYAKRNYH